MTTTQDHIDSYYAATANDTTRYPALRGSVKADVCVIGGGFSGIATALTMAERGHSVVVLEANRIGWGASGRNGGQMIAGISGEAEIVRQCGAAGTKLVRDMRYRGHEIIAERVAKYAIACDLKYGWMEAAARPSHMATLREHVKERIAEGDELEIVEAGDMPRFLGTKAYYGGYVDRRSGHLHPLNLCLGEARAAASLGVQIFEGSRVIDFGGGDRPWVQAEGGRVDAKTIVMAGEIFDRFKRRRLHGLMLPTLSFIAATEPLGEDLAREINPQDLAVADSNVVLDYFRLSADRRLLFGGRCDYSNRDKTEIAPIMRPRMLNVFPQLESVKIDYAWKGTIAIIINRVPAVGELEPNVYFMQGYCGHGVNATHVMAEIIGDAICGDEHRLKILDGIKHVRLPLSDYFGNEILAAGMLYYRLKDMI